MADYVVVDKEQLEADLTIVADSIRSKGGTTEKLSFPQGMKNAVESIRTGSGDGIDTNSNNPATASDIAEGKEAFVNGVKITGTVAVRSGGKSANTVHGESTKISAYYNDTSKIALVHQIPEGNSYLLKDSAFIRVVTPFTNFGDATPEDVAEGKTFTSASGLKVTGTHKCSSGATSGSIVKSKETTNFTIISGYSNLSVKYSSSVVDNNGELALGGTTNSVSVNTASDLDVIKGKYIEKSSSGATAIYYIPEDTTITQTGSAYSKSYVASKANQMFMLG